MLVTFTKNPLHGFSTSIGVFEKVRRTFEDQERSAASSTDCPATSRARSQSLFSDKTVAMRSGASGRHPCDGKLLVPEGPDFIAVHSSQALFEGSEYRHVSAVSLQKTKATSAVQGISVFADADASRADGTCDIFNF